MTDYFLLVTCFEYYNHTPCVVLWVPNLTTKVCPHPPPLPTRRYTNHLLATFWDIQMHTPMTRYTLWRIDPRKKPWRPGRWALASFGREFHCSVPEHSWEIGKVNRTSCSWAYGPVDFSLYGERTSRRRMQTGAFKKWRPKNKVGTTQADVQHTL